jgi:hypothetical protein
LVTTSRKIRYGDPDLNYGDPGIVYGGYKVLPDVKPYLLIDSGLSLSQKIEPEQGKGSVSTLSIYLIDYNQEVSALISPGVVVDELLGNKQVKIWIGYQNNSFPEDYFVVFRGYITAVSSLPGRVQFQFSDANFKTKQQVFYSGLSKVQTLTYPFAPADVNTGTSQITITDAIVFLAPNLRVNFSGTVGSTLPAPLAPSTDYFLLNPTAGAFQVSSTRGGSLIPITTVGVGNFTMTIADYGDLATHIPLYKTEGFIEPILGPNGGYDPSFKTYIVSDTESMGYGAGDILVASTLGTQVPYVNVTRSARGSQAVYPEAESDITNGVEITGNIIDSSLKIYLSGWNGVWVQNCPIHAFVDTGDPLIGPLPNAMVLPDGVDAVEQYGLAIGDYVYVTGSGFNNGTYTVTGFSSARGYANNLVLLSGTLVNETSLSGTVGQFSIRSQYDTFPAQCGMQQRPTDVDVAQFQLVKTQFVSYADCTFRNWITEPQSAKSFIESQYYLPAGLYGITRFGRISVTANKPPMSSDNLVVIDNTMVINPNNMILTRQLNARRFYNEIDYRFDYLDDNTSETSVVKILDTDSLQAFDINSVLPIQAQGLRTDLGALSFINRRGNYILRRFRNIAHEIQLSVTWEVGAQVQVGDCVALNDDGFLQITNLATGERNLGQQLFEVIDWQLNISAGMATLKLLTFPGYQITDRFAGIAPSSQTSALGSTATQVKIKNSYGALFPGQEYLKWQGCNGQKILIHSPDWTNQYETVLLGFSSVDPNIMLLQSSLPFPVLDDYIVECARYPVPVEGDNQKFKNLFCFIDPTDTVLSGLGVTSFVCTNPSLYTPGLPVIVRDANWSYQSPEVNVLTVNVSVVVLDASLGFTPSSGDKVELIGFTDGLGPYRIL